LVNTDAHQKDVQDWAGVYVREARVDAAAVAYLVDVMGRACLEARPVTLTQDNLLKLAAVARLHRWERAGLATVLGAGLPTARDVIEDLLADPRRPSRFSGRELTTKVLYAHLTRAAWHPWDGADVAIDQAGSADRLLDALAKLLWNHRHLSRTP
jgi:hypothetical protein